VEGEKDISFNIHFDYKNQLKHYQKIHFDPFSRGDRIPFFMNGTCIITTIGQLNFFKWFISKKVFDYLQIKKEDVYNDMNKKNKIERKAVKKINNQFKIKNEQKKPQIMISNTKDLDKRTTKILVSFE
jgi:hypothetical protein